MTQPRGYCCIGLINPKTPDNVGAVMRAAGCYGATSVFYTGTRYDRAKQFVTDTKRVSDHIPLTRVERLEDVVPMGCIPVAVEMVEGAVALPDYRHPRRAFYIFGSEDEPLRKTRDIRAWCRDVIYVPTHGCMNLAASVNVVLYDRLAKGDHQQE